MLLVQKEDTILDYNEAVKKFKRSCTIIEDGGIHRFENVENHIEGMVDFLSMVKM